MSKYVGGWKDEREDGVRVTGSLVRENISLPNFNEEGLEESRTIIQLRSVGWVYKAINATPISRDRFNKALPSRSCCVIEKMLP
jgi:hypothetical protein